MKIQYGYKSYETWKWNLRYDTGGRFLECPKCKSRVKLDQYIKAVGTKGMSFCPYCGEDLREEEGK